MVLTYGAYTETLEEQRIKEDVISTLSDKVTQLMQEMELMKK